MIVLTSRLGSTNSTEIDSLSCLVICNNFCFGVCISDNLTRREKSFSKSIGMSQFSDDCRFIRDKVSNRIVNFNLLISNHFTFLEGAIDINNINYNVIDQFICREVRVKCCCIIFKVNNTNLRSSNIIENNVLIVNRLDSVEQKTEER